MIIEVECLVDIYNADFSGCGAIDWCIDNNAFHLAAKKGEHLYVNFDMETRLCDKRIAKGYMKVLNGGTYCWNKIFRCFSDIDSCKEYKGATTYVDIRELRFIQKID